MAKPPAAISRTVLVAIFAERESHAAYFLQERDMTRYDAVNQHQSRHRQVSGPDRIALDTL
jgi:hypothetical protein